MLRYLKLWLEFLKMSWMSDLEYRLNITVQVIGEMTWYTAQLSTFEVLYTHTKTLYGWDVHAMRVFMGALFLVDVLTMIFLHENMDNLNKLVKTGDLDLYLVKPINSQFMVSLRKISIAHVFDLALVLAYLTWAISRLEPRPDFLQLLSFAFLVGCGFLVFYAGRFMFVTMTIFLQDAGNLQFVWYQIYRLGTRPDILYPFKLRLVLMTVLPMAFFASVPARALINGVSVLELLAAATVVTVFLTLASWGWHKALRHYASASS
jgi:ABC-2 type transport system permease protein